MARFILLGFVLAALMIDIAPTAHADAMGSGAGSGGPPVVVDLATIPRLSATTPAAVVPFRYAVSDDEQARRVVEAATLSLPVRPSLMLAPHVPAAPPLTASFATMQDDVAIPPDGALAASPTQLVELVNVSFAVYSKTGALLSAPMSFANFYAPLHLPIGTILTDPRVLYDGASGRWIATVDAVNFSTFQAWVLLSISTGSDATTSWSTYTLDSTLNGSTPSGLWADYPTFGMDSQALYIGMNMYQFSPTGTYQYSKLRIISKAQVLANLPVTWSDFWNLQNYDGTSSFTLQPALTTTPAVGEYVLATSTLVQANYLTEWTVTNPLGNPPTLSRSTIFVPIYVQPPAAIQAGTAIAIDADDTRILNAVFRNGWLWAAQDSQENFGVGNTSSGVIYQINPSAGTVAQVAYAGSSGYSFYYPTVMLDSLGNAVVVVNCSGGTLYASVCITGHATGDPANTFEAFGVVAYGQSTYYRPDGSGRNRWGDYSAAALDPDGVTLWAYGEYAAATNLWGTGVIGAQFPTVVSPTPTVTPTVTVTSTVSPTATATPTVTSTPVKIFLPEMAN